MSSAIQHFRRYHGYDYTRGASVFITLVTEPRVARFGRVLNAAVSLSPLGASVAESLQSMPARIPEVSLFGWVVMPDHVHFSVHLKAGVQEPLKTLGSFVGRFKSFTTKCFWDLGGEGKLWQQGYHDRICSTRPFIDAVERYIKYNPLKYELRYNHPEFLRIEEPLESARLDPETFWKGLGNTSLLNQGKILGLRISRQLATPESIGKAVTRCRDAVNAGYTVLSGFISPGEKAVREMLLSNPAAKLIHILPAAMPHDFIPDSIYLEAIRERRMLTIASGNEDIAFSRYACDEMNKAIVEIANADDGLAVYWREDGPQILRSALKTP